MRLTMIVKQRERRKPFAWSKAVKESVWSLAYVTPDVLTTKFATRIIGAGPNQSVKVILIVENLGSVKSFLLMG